MRIADNRHRDVLLIASVAVVLSFVITGNVFSLFDSWERVLSLTYLSATMGCLLISFYTYNIRPTLERRLMLIANLVLIQKVVVDLSSLSTQLSFLLAFVMQTALVAMLLTLVFKNLFLHGPWATYPPAIATGIFILYGVGAYVAHAFFSSE